MPVTLDDLRRLAILQSLFPPATLKRALDRMQFVQADPIRAPARAQDLILRHRVKGYRAGDLDRRYSRLGVEEDFFINYGFVTWELQRLMHPRTATNVPAAGFFSWPAARRKRALQLLDFVRQRGSVHPKVVGAHFPPGKVKNYWGGHSNATTHLLDNMHYLGLLRVVRRESGIRIYAAREHAAVALDAAARASCLDALADAVIRIYAPMPLRSLRSLLLRLRYAVPHWEEEIQGVIQRATERLAHAKVDGLDWYWPADWKRKRTAPDDSVCLLAPFDPVVWDRYRFELLWGWTYRFEAYTPKAKRIRGYYALPMLWRHRVIGWANLSVEGGVLRPDIGYIDPLPPRDKLFKGELERELDRMRLFLGLRS